jgi:hypothetical protein
MSEPKNRDLVRTLIIAHLLKESIDTVKNGHPFVKALKMQTGTWMNFFNRGVTPILVQMYNSSDENSATYEAIIKKYEDAMKWFSQIEVERLDMAVMALEGIAKKEIVVEEIKKQ